MVPFRMLYIFVTELVEYHCRLCEGETHEQAQHGLSPKKNACRIIRSLINKTDGMTLDIPIDVCPVTVRMRRPVRRLEVWWPILRMDQWAKLLFNQKPQLLLGGQVPDPQGKWKKLYYDFWSVYQNIHGDHPIFSRKDVDMGTCLPYMIHGDEGRGQLKRPYLVVSWQLLIGHNGLQATNDSGYHGVYSGDRHFLFLFHEWCHFKPLSQWNLANP